MRLTRTVMTEMEIPTTPVRIKLSATITPRIPTIVTTRITITRTICIESAATTRLTMTATATRIKHVATKPMTTTTPGATSTERRTTTIGGKQRHEG
jgi:hypothetical protein